ncbi:MAG: MFS transporter [Steroidobacteraceae bacterium]
MPNRSSPNTPGRFRFVVMSALWVTGMFLFFDRVNISLAVPHIKQDLGLTGVQTGMILSVFFWGYVLGQVAGGIAADRLRIRTWTLVFYVIWCIATVTTGLCRTLTHFAIVRALFGLSEGAVINPVYKLMNHWVLPAERGFANGVQICFGYLGLVIGTPIIAALISVFGWRSMFFITGAVTLVGVLVFWLLVYDHPRDHPWISAAERDRIEDELAKDRVTYDPSRQAAAALPFRDGLRMLAGNPAFWLVCSAFFFTAGVYFTNLSWLPGYLVMERGLSGLDSGFTLVLPYSAAALGALCGGTIADRIGNRSLVVITSVLLTVPAIYGLLVLEGRMAMITMLCLMLFLNASAIAVFIVLLFDLLPAEVIGVAVAVNSGVFGGTGGIVGPLVMGWSFDLTGSFAMGFMALAAGLVVSAALTAFVFKHERRVSGEKKRKALQAAGAVGEAS